MTFNMHRISIYLQGCAIFCNFHILRSFLSNMSLLPQCRAADLSVEKLTFSNGGRVEMEVTPITSKHLAATAICSPFQ